MAIYTGLMISPGVALGPASCLQSDDFSGLIQKPCRSAKTELQNFKEALKQALDALDHRLKALKQSGDPHTELWEAHRLMLEDSTLEHAVIEAIAKKGLSAASAVASFFDALIARISAKRDRYLQERSEDVEVVRRYLLRTLSGRPALDQLPLGETPYVLVLSQLTSSETSVLDPKRVVAIISETGARTSHGAIMARTLGIPALLGVRDATKKIATGDWVYFDGAHKEVRTPVPPTELAQCRQAVADHQARQLALQTLRDKPAQTSDAWRIQLHGNLAHTEEIEQAQQQGLDGVGLMRSEFIFMNRRQAPDEEEQHACYRQILKAFAPRPVVIRTMDIGGDKPVPYLNLSAESNPFLGNRGVRFSLSRPELFQVQLRALLRAGLVGDLRWMFPMVNNLEEVRQIKCEIEAAKLALHQRRVPFKESIPFGIMIETPSAVMMADWLAEEVDFFSIGTNDLTQYLCAADRLNEAMMPLCQPLYPAVLKAIHQVIQAGGRRGIEVALCGEMGSDPQIVPLLLGMGLRELSMSPLMVPATKQLILNLQGSSAQRLAEEVLKLRTLEAVQKALQEA